MNKAKEKLQLYKDYLLEDEDIKSKKGYPANPPKIKKFINIIYYDDNYNNELMQLNMELDLLEFKKKQMEFLFSVILLIHLKKLL